jgi:hypothetical protein
LVENWLIMEDLWSHPLVVATYAAMFSMVVGGIRAVIKLFDRVTDLEKSLAELHNDLDTLSTELRAHMADESRNVQQLETTINNLAASMGRPQIGLRSE